jgi:hypothetical protein
MAREPLLGQGLLNIEASRSHSVGHSVGLLWTSDRLYQRPLPDNQAEENNR